MGSGPSIFCGLAGTPLTCYAHILVFRERLANEIKEYLEHCEIEQRERLTGETSPDFETYVALRCYTSAVRIYCYITP